MRNKSDQPIMLTLDAHAKVSLSKFQKRSKVYKATIDKKGRITLEPIEIPDDEAWIHKLENRHILMRLQKAMRQDPKTLHDWTEVKKALKIKK